MTLFDFLLILSLVGFVWFGFWFGIIHMVGGLVGTVAGAWLAGHFYDKLTGPLQMLLGTNSTWVELLSFVFIFIVANRLVGFIFYILDRTFRFISVIPFLKTINHLGGALLGLIEGVLVIGLTLYFANRIDLPIMVEEAIVASRVALKFISIASVLVPLLPDIIKQVQPYVPGVNLPIPQ